MTGPRITAGALLLFCMPTLADDVPQNVDTIVVTGSRSTDQLEEIPNTTTVILLEELEARNAVSVPDALLQIPGIHIVQPSGQGGVARLFIRGGDQNLTMILLDGVRVNDPNDSRGSAFDFSAINLSDIERIEIVRGPQSAVYGSDSLAGVINIISKPTADEFGGSVFLEGGSDSYQRGALDISGPIGSNGGFSLRVMSKDDGEPVTDTTFESDSVAGRVTLGNADAWDLRFFANYADSSGTSFPEDSGGADLAVIRTIDTRSAESLRMGANGHVSLAPNWDLNFLTTWYDQDSSYLSPGVAPGVRDGVPPNGADSNLKRSNIAVNAVVDVSDSLTATFGMDYYDEEGTSVGFVEFFPGFILPAGFVFDRNVTGAFGEIHFVPQRGPTVMASVRRDDSSNEPAKTTSRLGILQAFNNGNTQLRANWGQGFSLPGFFALASPLVGNPDLRPETSKSYDLGLTHSFVDAGIETTITIFHNEFTDLIDFESSVFQMVNRDRLDVDGVELQMVYTVSDALSIQAQATHLDMELVGSNLPLRQRPDWRGGLSISWLPTASWGLDASWLYSGETFDSSIPTGDQFLDSYNRLDVTATYHHNDALHAVLSITNVFDEDYFEAIGFPAPSTRARLGIRYQF
jgi:vitamin B12 transporter